MVEPNWLQQSMTLTKLTTGLTSEARLGRLDAATI